MRRCPRCDAAASADQTTCGSCGQTLGSADPHTTGDRPAHLAILDSVKGASSEQALESQESGGAEATSRRSSKPRLVSRAGPAVPALAAKNDDSVPNGSSGWMARLEAAKKSGANQIAEGSGSSKPAAVAPPPLQKGPPPLKKKTQPQAEPGNGGGFTSKPAHLLVAELEAQQREKREAKAKKAATDALEGAQDEVSKSEIAQVEMPKPEARIVKKKIPTWVMITVPAIVAIGAVGAGLYYAQREPPPPAPAVDPELIAKAERQKEAIAAVNEGHELYGNGSDKEKIDRAIALYNKAVELAPDLARAERALGIAYAKKGDDEEAVKHYKRFLELDPTAPEAAQVRAIIDKYNRQIGSEKEKKK